MAAARFPAAVKPHLVETLKRIAAHGGLRDFAALSTKELGTLLGVSQQSASQRILELLRAGLIARDLGGRQQRIKLTAKGVEALRREYAEYQRIFESKGTVQVRGTVTTGLGEGAFYMRQEGYKAQFRAKIGYVPYEGTLNLKVDGENLARLDRLRAEDGLLIEGFTAAGRTFGGVKCFPATLKGLPCAAILPLRTHHTDVLEVISAENLRERLRLRDGEAVELHVQL